MSIIRTRALIDDETRAAGTPLRFIIASAGVKRDGLDLEMDRFGLDNFQRNPVMLWMHGSESARGALPIGRWQSLKRSKRNISGEAVFDADDDFARQIERKYRDGYLNAVSVSWLPEQVGDGWRYEMLEASAVSVPADPEALVMGRDFVTAFEVFEGDAVPAVELVVDEVVDESSVDVRRALVAPVITRELRWRAVARAIGGLS